MSSEKSFCFCRGELVDCIPGRVQDCNIKQVKECMLDKKDTNGFCFCKGELVTCSSGRIQDCNIKQLGKCPKE